MGSTSGTEPVARITASGARARRGSSMVSVFSRMFTPACFARTIMERMASEICPLPVGQEAMRKLPPSSLSFSTVDSMVIRPKPPLARAW